MLPSSLNCVKPNTFLADYSRRRVLCTGLSIMADSTQQRSGGGGASTSGSTTANSVQYNGCVDYTSRSTPPTNPEPPPHPPSPALQTIDKTPICNTTTWFIQNQGFYPPPPEYANMLMAGVNPPIPVPPPLNNDVCTNTYTSTNQICTNSNNTRLPTDQCLVEMLRKWELVNVENPNADGLVFSVMNYNVLAQDLLNQHPYLYLKHSARDLNWDKRWTNLLTELKHWNPDILCLQEVQKSHIAKYYSQLENLGYHVIYKQRTGGRTDGCAIYFKKNIFTLIEFTPLEYFQPNTLILDRDNVAIIAKFTPKNQPKCEFIVATTHLLYNPKRQDVRLAQTQLLLAELDRFAYKSGDQNYYLPIILTGDFNSSPETAVYNFLTTGKLNYETLTQKSLLSTKFDLPRVGKILVPPALRVTDQCQHIDLMIKRKQHQNLTRTEEQNLIRLRNSCRQSTRNQKQNNEKFNNDSAFDPLNNCDSALGQFSSGTLTHNFHLNSVYQHHFQGDLEATTFQHTWLTVDYIFFTNTNNHRLQLLHKLSLLRESQLKNICIPNHYLGSDHFSLMAKFKLFF